tara:strand:+ start:275 stop:814 length:540 start_codon:yes stop_codon:yes gene_type:complete
MGDPISIGLAIAGTATSVVGSVRQAGALRQAGEQAEKTARYNQSIRERNAKVAENNADYRRRVGEREVRRFQEQFGKLQARAGVAFRKAGVVASTGTPLEVLAENANQAEIDVQTIRLQAASQAGQMREQGANERLAGQLTLLEGRSQRAAYNMQARSTMFNAFTSLAEGGYRVGKLIK